ncbi:DUF3732 domain-containing protein [Neptunomonas marina]|uniref:DUF3732 domain-containing protein n=1 Tax=Neptunomonas marina TaxID=1815562 RepID=A0A437Q4V0_9GAMM|nr:DUF3732 domain-containing protein [Neptunomonas marina]RVU29548.1 DUF3732 domain-containing protein [Neptunomonas marina]
MIRWNIASIFFLGVSGRSRALTFKPGEVNIITGASGTGKSTIIKAIDYCLGSSKCELPVHVRRHSTAVGVKWVAGEDELIVGRLIPPVGQTSSSKMFATSGRNLPIPQKIEEFDGSTTTNAAKAFIERAFGIGDIGTDSNATSSGKARATVRNLTPYLFVTKEVIDSESVLFHGLEKAEKARDILASMPYFLRATDEASFKDERRLRQLLYILDNEEARTRSLASKETALKKRAMSLISEAHRIGITTLPPPDASEEELLQQIEGLSQTQLQPTSYPVEGELGALHEQRREILNKLTDVKRKSHATRSALREANGFEDTVTRQRSKLRLAEHFKLGEIASVCPVCESPSKKGQETANALQKALNKVQAESAAVERVKPKLVEHDRELKEEITQLNSALRRIDNQIKAWLQQTDEARKLNDIAQLKAHLLGRISFFLESSTDEKRQTSPDLTVLRDDIKQLEARVNPEEREIRLRRAEAKISAIASKNLQRLPTVAPCIGAELDFSSRRPEVSVIEADTDELLKLPDVGSDQNYLAIHIALAFALQKHFELVESPVPGVLVLDQISRPYFPTRGENDDETEIAGEREDEEVKAMRTHIDFLFSEVEQRTGLQVILIEHAYFADDSRYVSSTRQRWTRASKEALIPIDWPTR